VTSSTACTDAREFVDQVRRRTARLRLAVDVRDALRFRIELRPAAQGVEGSLAVRESDGRLTTREVPGADCHEVLSAMALIAALMVDPFASLAPAAELPAPEPEPEPSRSEPPRPVSVPSAWSYAAGEHFVGETAAAPGLSVGTAVHVSMARSFGGMLEPSVRLAALVTRGDSPVYAQGGQAAFLLTVLRLSACPIRWPADDRFRLRPCAVVDVGRLRGAGSGILDSRTQTIAWTAAGAEAELEAVLVGPLRFDADLGVFFPFSRNGFYFVPEPNVHRIPVVGLSFGVGLSLRFF
jgi:hypothetical protein